MPYRTPGVYVEEIAKFPPSIAAVETAIPAFIGYTERAEDPNGEPLVLKPWRITSLLEYERFFGYPDSEKSKRNLETNIEVTLEGDEERFAIKPTVNRSSTDFFYNMYYAMQMFFANGGGPCYIVSVGVIGESSQYDIADGLDAIALEDEPTMLIVPEAAQNQNASSHPIDNASTIEKVLQQCEKLQDRVGVFDVSTNLDATTSTEMISDATTFRGLVPATVDFKKYGAAYYPYLKTRLYYEYMEEDVTVFDNRDFGTGGGSLGTGVGTGGEYMLSEIKDADDELYNQIRGKLNELYVVLPPSSAVAGLYALVDRTRGVWKAPANISVSSVVGPTLKLDNSTQDQFNVDSENGKSINAIRAFVGKGTLVWGARTLAGNDNEWRYISVRRFFNFVEESVKKGTGRFVFEPNDANTWVKVRTMIENFLVNQWRAGALTGATPEQAFYVRVGLNETMSAQDILEGYLIVEIGMAVVRPAEFIVLRFSHKMQEA